MRISWKSVVVLVFVVLISGSVPLSPASAKSLIYPIDTRIKDLPVEPIPILGEPGDQPGETILFSSCYIEIPIPGEEILEDEDMDIQPDINRNRVIRFINSKLLKLTGKTF
ncbi:MAG: hypothetical protein JW746_05010 [Candidatus Krumholzibacteriota bacterium]|nr:hypothetical protein [Candidatus Krumholzibacteriota bacterium]